MAQPHCCCRLKQAEVNGIVASRCVWRPPSPHEIISCFHMHFLFFTRSFWKIWSYLNQIPNSVQLSVQPMKTEKMPVSHKLSEASRLNSLFCPCLILKLSKSMAQPHCCCRLKQAEINGIVASRCLWWPPSLHEIISCWHMMSLSTSCSSHVPFERSGHTRTKFQTRCNCQCNLWKRKKCRSHISYLKRQDWTAFSVSVWFPSSPNQWRNRTVAAGWKRPR